MVFAGRHRRLERDVAIKQLPRAFAADRAVRARFVAEGRLLASLDHPHVVPVYDFVEHDGLCLLVMERLRGGTVAQRARGGSLAPAVACAVALSACAGLQHAHERGLLHRDIKPANLLFSGSGVLKVADFGIAKVLGATATFATASNELIGTIAFMAPEQIQGSELTPATDVYALATTLYLLLAGTLPFPADDSIVRQLHRRLYHPPLPLLRAAPQLPPALASTVDRGLAADPGERPQTTDALGVSLACAAAAAWGLGWLDRTGVGLASTGPIADAVRTGQPLDTADETLAARPAPPRLREERVLNPTRSPRRASLDDATGANAENLEPSVTPGSTSASGELAPVSAQARPAVRRLRALATLTLLLLLVVGASVAIIEAATDRTPRREGAQPPAPRVAATVELNGRPTQIAAVGGDIWVVDQVEDAQTAEQEPWERLWRVFGSSNLLSESPRVGWGGVVDHVKLTAAGEWLWVGYGSTVMRVRGSVRQTGAPGRAVPPAELGKSTRVDGRIADMAADTSGVWVVVGGGDRSTADAERDAATSGRRRADAAPRQFVRLEQRTGRVVARHSAPRRGVRAVATGLGSLWALQADGRTLLEIDPTTGRATRRASLPAPATGPVDVAVSRSAVWVADARNQTVTRFDDAHSTLTSIAVPGGPRGLTIHGDDVWIAGFGDHTLTRVNARSARVVGKPLTVGLNPTALAVTDRSVWTANAGDNTLTRVDYR